MQSATDVQVLKIPTGSRIISYRFEGNSVFRRTANDSPWIMVLSRVKTSQMEAGHRNSINAWQWDVELIPRHTKAKTRQWFTFEAVAPAKP